MVITPIIPIFAERKATAKPHPGPSIPTPALPEGEGVKAPPQPSPKEREWKVENYELCIMNCEL